MSNSSSTNSVTSTNTNTTLANNTSSTITNDGNNTRNQSQRSTVQAPFQFEPIEYELPDHFHRDYNASISNDNYGKEIEESDKLPIRQQQPQQSQPPSSHLRTHSRTHSRAHSRTHSRSYSNSHSRSQSLILDQQCDSISTNTSISGEGSNYASSNSQINLKPLAPTSRSSSPSKNLQSHRISKSTSNILNDTKSQSQSQSSQQQQSQSQITLNSNGSALSFKKFHRKSCSVSSTSTTNSSSTTSSSIRTTTSKLKEEFTKHHKKSNSLLSLISAKLSSHKKRNSVGSLLSLKSKSSVTKKTGSTEVTTSSDPKVHIIVHILIQILLSRRLHLKN
ncbi:unnamed protein product [[Candida] boidinii]|nr:unnamed protein product [[Candida] boidinii]